MTRTVKLLLPLNLVFVALMLGCQATRSTSTIPSRTATNPIAATGTNQLISKPIPISSLADRWLSGSPCSAPCWENLTPGAVTATEAVKLLNENSLFRNVTESDVLNVHSISWQWDVLYPDGAIHTWHGEALVNAQQLVYATTIPLPSVLLSDLIRAYGEPTGIVIQNIFPTDVGGRYTWNLYILWTPLGVATYTGGATSQPKIDPYLVLEKAIFFIPGLDGFGQATTASYADLVQPWVGYDSYVPLTLQP